MATVVKRRGSREQFDSRKIYASVFAACRSVKAGKHVCEDLADAVTEEIKEFVSHREEVLSTEIRERVREELQDRNQDVADAYYTY